MMKAGKKTSPQRSRVAKWEWRKNYRVWDANRKIFLYPENWVEPELRPPHARLSSLREVVAAVRAQSGARAKKVGAKGVRVLFTGNNRAGALASTEILARDLAIDLYRIDLSGVVSKYIGETEKNLRRIFDAAEKRNAILFFDEADALFGKHTGVKDSHDRYALLQRMEDFKGLAILSTKRHLDAPFLRRLRFITIPLPSLRKRAPRKMPT